MHCMRVYVTNIHNDSYTYPKVIHILTFYTNMHNAACTYPQFVHTHRHKLYIYIGYKPDLAPPSDKGWDSYTPCPARGLAYTHPNPRPPSHPPALSIYLSLHYFCRSRSLARTHAHTHARTHARTHASTLADCHSFTPPLPPSPLSPPPPHALPLCTTDGKNVLEEFYSAPRDREGHELAAHQARAIVILLAGAKKTKSQKYSL